MKKQKSIDCICDECAKERGLAMSEDHVASYWTDICDACKKETMVTDIQDFDVHVLPSLDEEIERRFPINVAMIRPCNLSTRNKWIQQGIMWYKDKLAKQQE